MNFTYLETFINQIDVNCPHCKSMALVTSNSDNRIESRFSCLKCGHSKKWTGNTGLFYSAPLGFITDGILMGQPVDCFFKLPLWFVTEVKNEILYGYNLAHLDFLENYIGSKLRGRKMHANGWSNQSLESRLPQWMLSAKNRSDVLKGIKDLKDKK